MVKAKVNPSDVREKLTGAVLFSGRSLGKKVLILQSSPVVLQVGRLGMYMIIYCEIYIEDIYILSEKVRLKCFSRCSVPRLKPQLENHLSSKLGHNFGEQV